MIVISFNCQGHLVKALFYKPYISLDHDLDNTTKDLIMILHGIIFVFLSIHFLYSDLNFKGFCWMAEKRKPQREEERNRHKVSYSESKERRKDMFWKDVFCSWLSQSMC